MTDSSDVLEQEGEQRQPLVVGPEGAGHHLKLLWELGLFRFLNYHRIVFPYRDEPALRQLIDEYRVRCLWFLREGYYPTTAAECERVFELIERHGDVEAFRRVAAMRAWLSHRSSETSAGF